MSKQFFPRPHVKHVQGHLEIGGSLLHHGLPPGGERGLHGLDAGESFVDPETPVADCDDCNANGGETDAQPCHFGQREIPSLRLNGSG